MLSKPRPLAPCVTSSEPEDHRQFNQSWAFSSTLFRASQQGIGHQRQPPLFGTGPRHKYRQNSEEPVVKHPWWVFCSLRGRSGGGQRGCPRGVRQKRHRFNARIAPKVSVRNWQTMQPRTPRFASSRDCSGDVYPQ